MFDQVHLATENSFLLASSVTLFINVIAKIFPKYFKYWCTLLVDLPRKYGSLNPGEGGTPSNGLYGEAPPERGTFLRLLGRVVRKPVNVNTGLIVNWGITFSCLKIFFASNIWCSLRLLQPKTEGETIETEHHTNKLQNWNQNSH